MGQKTKKLLGNLTRREPIENQPTGNVVGNTQIKAAEIESVQEIKKTEKKDLTSVTKTFYIAVNDVATIESFVALRRMEGDLRYPIKNAIKEAFDLLKLAEKKGGRIGAGDAIESERKNKTLNMYKSDFEYIEEMYKKRRLQGETKYTQADAIKEALILLRKKYPTIV